MTLVPLLLAGLIQGQEAPYAKDIEAFKVADNAFPPAKGQILFIGSSSFTRWTSVQEAFPNHRILNRGFGGSSLGDVGRYLDAIVFPYQPSQVVMYCGENDFAASPDLSYGIVVDRFKGVFREIRKRLPRTPFAYVSMKPSPSRWNLAFKFTAANAAIREFLSTQPRTAFVDVWPVMLGTDGLPKPEIYVEDKLHMNEKGYALWTPLIESVLVKR